jgi:hypothetical protein
MPLSRSQSLPRPLSRLLSLPLPLYLPRSLLTFPKDRPMQLNLCLS